MNKDVLFSSKTDIWATPIWIYNKFIDKKYFDPCPIDPLFDGLKIKWPDKVYCNPPYSEISKWIDKCIYEMYNGSSIYLLIPARTDTKYFKKLYDNGHFSFIFIHSRLKFGSSKNSAPFPSVLIYGDSRNMRNFYLLTQDELCKYLERNL